MDRLVVKRFALTARLCDQGGDVLLRVIRPDADCLASVLIASCKFTSFEDIWRYRADLRIEVLIDRYVRFILSEVDLYKHFTIMDINALEAYRSSEKPETLAKIYPYYTRDVILAQAVEVLRADALNTRPTEIVYTSPDSRAVVFRVCSIPNRFIERGKSLLATELATRGIMRPLTVGKLCEARMRFCFASYAYSELALKQALPSWNMDE